jgi:hypothetical protein
VGGAGFYVQYCIANYLFHRGGAVSEVEQQHKQANIFSLQYIVYGVFFFTS